MTVLEMAERIRDISSSKSNIVFKPLPVDDPKVRQPDISLAKEVLDWSPVMDVNEGLRNTVDYFKKVLQVQ